MESAKRYVQCTGVPSLAELDRLNKDDDERIAMRIQELGPAGLKKKGDELAEAIAINEVPVPSSILTSVAKPNPSSIHFHNVNIYRTGDRFMPVGLDLEAWPTYAEFYHCLTKFVYITGTFFTHTIPPTLRPYLTLFFKLIRSSRISSTDKSIASLNDLIPVKTASHIGLSDPKEVFSCGSFSQTATFMIQVKRSEYEIGVQYFIAKLQKTFFSYAKIKNAVTSLLKDVAHSQENFYASTLDLLKAMNYDSGTNVKTNSVMLQKEFMTTILAKMKHFNTSREIMVHLTLLRAILVTASNLAVHVTTDFNELRKTKTDLNAAWKHFTITRGPKKLNIVSDWEVMNAAKNMKNQGEVLGLDSTKSSYVYHSTPSINNYNHKDLAPLYVAISYLSGFQGPMHNRMRGPGYTYDCALNIYINEGQIRLVLYRASDPVNAFNEFVKIVNERIQPNAVWDLTLVDGAKGVAIYRISNMIPAIGDIASYSLLLSFKNVSTDHHTNMISKISAVTIVDLKRVAQLYLSKLLSTTETKTAIICSKDEAKRIADGFKKLGFNLHIRQSWDESALGHF